MLRHAQFVSLHRLANESLAATINPQIRKLTPPKVLRALTALNGAAALFLDEFMRRMVLSETREADLNFCGFSVTNPHKQSIIKYLDHIDETAKAIGRRTMPLARPFRPSISLEKLPQ
ncbi:MAG: hypothetical protein ABI680_09785, partial [Chthoniobacteraceae bacterium]